MGTNDFRLRVVGTQFDNEDGSSRQEELAQCVEGEPVTLEREPENRHDPSAVAVYSTRGAKIGFIGADRCGWIGSKISRGYDVRAAIDRLSGGKKTGMPIGLVIKLNLDGEEPD